MILPLVTSTIGLPVLGIGEADLRVGQRPGLVEAVQICSRQAMRLAFLEVAAQSDVPVRQCEQ